MIGTERSTALLQLHLGVFIASFTAILGNVILMSPLYLVWWRVFLTLISFLFFKSLLANIRRTDKKDRAIFVGIGFLIGFHWIFFYASIKLANASVALIALSATSFFTAFIQPLFFKTKISVFEILLGALMVFGIYLIADGLNSSMNLGLIAGLLSALFACFFSVLNKKYINRTDPVSLTFLEIVGVFILCSICLPIYLLITGDWGFMPSGKDFLYLTLLALICTTYAFMLIVKSLKHLPVFLSNLTFNLEPIYGLLLAVVLFHEHKELGLRFYLGSLTILSGVFIYPLANRYRR